MPWKRCVCVYYYIFSHLLRLSRKTNDTFLQDFVLMCKNTQQYNEDGSLIFEDSIVLQSVFSNARERIEQVCIFTLKLTIMF